MDPSDGENDTLVDLGLPVLQVDPSVRAIYEEELEITEEPDISDGGEATPAHVSLHVEDDDDSASRSLRRVSFAEEDDVHEVERYSHALPPLPIGSYSERRRKAQEAKATDPYEIADFWGDRDDVELDGLDSSEDEEAEGKSLLSTGAGYVTSTVSTVMSKLPLNFTSRSEETEYDEAELDAMHQAEDGFEGFLVRQRAHWTRRWWATFKAERIIQIATCAGCLLIGLIIGVVVYLVFYSDSNM